MFYFLSFLWFIRTTKASLFWIYLWQLKEYHLGRFLDHFRTDKGKKLFLNPVIFFKIALLFYALFLLYSGKLLSFHLYIYVIWIFIFLTLTLTVFYLFESIKFLKDFFQKTFKKPVLTQKTLILISLALIVEISFLYILFQGFYFVLSPNFYWFAFSLLLFDILTPLIVSIIVFLVHAFTVIFFRNKIIKKAKLRREEFKNLLVVGITGSYGKTSTKEFLAKILSEKATLRGGAAGTSSVLTTKEHQNSEIGISRCVLNDLTPEHEIFICEMGAYNKGGIKLLCDIAQPKIGIITGVNEQHLSTFGSMENLLSAEGGRELIESLPEDGIVFFNAENKYCLELYDQTKIKKFLYGKSVKLPGLENIEGAKMVAKKLGMTAEEISRACQKIKNKFGGIELKRGINGLNIIDATYSANPDGVIAHLEYLKTLPGRKIIVMPCLIELGSASSGIHKRIGQKIGEICDLAIITTKDRLKEIKEGASKGGMTKENILFLENPKEISKRIKEFLKTEKSSSGHTLSEDIVLLEGRGPQDLLKFLMEDKAPQRGA